MPQDWSGIANTTTANYIRKVEDNTLRTRKLTALMKDKGGSRSTGPVSTWTGRSSTSGSRGRGFVDGDTMTFTRTDRYKTARLDWRGYNAVDAITKGDMLKNKGVPAIIDMYAEKAKDLADDMTEWFSMEMYVNGNDPNFSKNIHGIESFLQAVQNPGNGAAKPTGTFADLNCTPGYYMGRWDGGPKYRANLCNGWPNGAGDTEFDFWSPTIVDYGDTLFDPSYHTWTNNCVDAITFLLIKARKSRSMDGQMDLVLVSDDMYWELEKQLRIKERIIVNDQRSRLIKLGFGDVINLDGCDVTWEFGTPGGNGYGFNTSQMELRSQQSALFVPDGPTWDQGTKTYRFSIDFYGNCVWNPKFFGKLINISNPGDE